MLLNYLYRTHYSLITVQYNVRIVLYSTRLSFTIPFFDPQKNFSKIVKNLVCLSSSNSRAFHHYPNPTPNSLPAACWPIPNPTSPIQTSSRLVDRMDDIVNALRRMIGIDAGDEPAENPEPPPQQDDNDDQEPQRDDDDDQEPQRDDDDNDDQEAQTQRGSSHSSDSTGSTRTVSDTTTATETEEGTTTETTATTEQTADDDGEAEADTNDDQQDENAAQDEDEDEEDCFVTKEEADLYDVTTNGSSRLAVISDEDIISTRSARDNSPPRQDVPAIQAPSDAVTARSSSRTDVHPAAEGNEEATAAGGNEDEPMALQELPSPRRPIEEDLTTARRPAAADALDQRRSAAAPAADVQTAREDDGRGTTTTTTTRSHVPARVPNQAELDTQTARRPRRPDPRARREPPCQCYALGRATCTCTFYLDY